MSLPKIRWAVFCFEQILDRVVTLLIVMRNLAEPTGQKRVSDRSEKNDGCNKEWGFAQRTSHESVVSQHIVLNGLPLLLHMTSEMLKAGQRLEISRFAFESTHVQNVQGVDLCQ